ncbi:MAG: protein kinase [bacterium]
MKKLFFLNKSFLFFLIISTSSLFGMQEENVNFIELDIIKIYKDLTEMPYVDFEDSSNEGMDKFMEELFNIVTKSDLYQLFTYRKDLIKDEKLLILHRALNCLEDILRRIYHIENNTKYRVVKKIGNGTDKIVFGVVCESEYPVGEFESEDEIKMNEVVVLFFDNTRREENFKKEVDFLSELDHENIIKIRAINHEYFYFFQDLACGDFFDFLVINFSKNEFCLEDHSLLSVVLKILKDVALALSYLHENRIIHRDIKLENILLFWDEDGDGLTAKLTDFSFAAQIIGDESIFEEFGLKGTSFYVDPKIHYDYLKKKDAGIFIF